jgi:dTDP-glucose pyrophosphorylase
MIIDKNLDPLVIRGEATLHLAMERLNSTIHIMQLVIDENGLLVGTITDGDIRRALLDGKGMDAAVSDCMRRDPLVGKTVEDAISLSSNLTGRLRCIPVVDDAGRPTEVVSDAARSPGLETALIMAGGFGRRLGGHTANTPKPLLPVVGQPILRHLISDLEENGVVRILIAAHYLADQIKTFVEEIPHRSTIDILVEDQPLGTAGALSMLPDDVTGPLMVLNGDIITHADFGAMALHHGSSGRDATIAATQHEIKIPFGVVEYDEKGTVISIQEKPHYLQYVLAGIYVLEETIYRNLPGALPLDMPDLLQHAISNALDIGMFPIHEYWMDLGNPEELMRARGAGKTKMDSHKGESPE